MSKPGICHLYLCVLEYMGTDATIDVIRIDSSLEDMMEYVNYKFKYSIISPRISAEQVMNLLKAAGYVSGKYPHYYCIPIKELPDNLQTLVFIHQL